MGAIKWIRCKAFSWLVLSLLCSFFLSNQARAVLAPFVWSGPANAYTPFAGSAEAACKLREYTDSHYEQYTASSGSASWGGTWGSFKKAGMAEGNCKSPTNSSRGYVSYGQFCPPGSISGTVPNVQCGSCPSGYIDVNGQCKKDCPIGYTELNGECVPPPCLDKKDKQIRSSIGNYYFATSGSDIGPSPSGCFEGCKYRVMNGFTGPLPLGGGFMLVATKMTGTGDECGSALPITVILEADIPTVPADVPGEPSGPDDCPAGTGFAEFGGKKACLPSGTSGKGDTSSSSDTSGNQTSTDSDWTINSDGTTSSKTTSTWSGSGGQSATTTTTGDKGLATVGGTGGSGSGTSSEGINFGPAPSFDSTLPEVSTENPTAPSMAALDVSYTRLGGVSGSCPAPISFTAMGVPVEIPFTGVCQFAPMIRAIFLLSAVFIGFRILIT